MPGNAHVPFEVSDHEFKMRLVNMVVFPQIHVAALTEVESKQKLDLTSARVLPRECIIDWEKDIVVVENV